jgi:hypothetical protein
MLITTSDFLIGGGIATFSIGAIYSIDMDSNLTTGCIILGEKFKWDKRTRDEFSQSLRYFNCNPLAIPVLVASILIHKAREEREAFVVTLKEVEGLVELILEGRNKGSETEKLTSEDYRSLITKLSRSARFLGRIQMIIERAKLIVKFMAKTTEIPKTLAMDTQAEAKETSARAIETAAEMDGSDAYATLRPHISVCLHERIKLTQSILEHMDADMINLSARLRSQNMITTNLVAQHDVDLSFQLAKDSKAIADAARRDGVTMKIIARIGAAFLPANLIAVSRQESYRSNAYSFRLFSLYSN